MRTLRSRPPLRTTPPVTVSRVVYGTLPGGGPAHAFILGNEHGVRVTLLEYGATLARVWAPDRAGQCADILVGCDCLQDWPLNTAHFGATLGRYANRIAHAAFRLDGRACRLTANEAGPHGENHLHGGELGFHRQSWLGRELRYADGSAGVEFSHLSRDGEEGYPGDLAARVNYELNAANELRVTYAAETSRPTIVNLSNHAYWNLTGRSDADILGHELRVAAETFLPVDARQIPTGRKQAVAGTPLDFLAGKPVGRDITAPHEQLWIGQGYDHTFVLSSKAAVRFAARVTDPLSGRCLEVHTDQPGVHLYTGNHLDGSGPSRARRHAGLCLETGNFPDAPNRPVFPSAVLRPGETYRHTLVFCFATIP